MKKKKEVLPEETINTSNIINVEYSDEMASSVLDYSMSSIVRAIPDARDGLKPVHRRILYTMHQDGSTFEKAYKKSAKTVGLCLANYHPHGDASVYDALIRLSQDFKMNLPLIAVHGNGGSIDGDPAAAMRYTEAKLGQASKFALMDLEKNVVEMVENFDASTTEPDVLPATFPNLLINGSQGISVGMATNIPSHNIGDVIDAIIAYIDKKRIDIEDLIDIIKGPDYPTGGVVVNKTEFKNFYRNGDGKAIIRAKLDIEDAGYGKTNIVVSEIPISSSGNKQKLFNDIIALVRNKDLPELSDVRDESSKDGIRIVLETKKGIDTNKLIAKLYKKTALQVAERYIFLTVVDKKPKILNLKEYIETFVEFQHELIVRKNQYLLDKAEVRREVLDGLAKAIDVIDVIIEVVRGASKSESAKECLISGKIEEIKFKTESFKKIAQKFRFTPVQAQAILSLRLQQLSGLELQAILDERDELLAKIKEYTDIIKSKKRQETIIKKQLVDFKATYMMPRKTKLVDQEVKEYVPEVVIEKQRFLLDKYGYCKVINEVAAEKQNVDSLEMEVNKKVMSNSRLFFFTRSGMVCQLKMEDVPLVAKVTEKGVPVENIMTIDGKLLDESIVLFEQKELDGNKFVMHTQNGYVKIVDGSEFVSNRASVKATNLEDGDSVMFFENCNNAVDVVVTTNKGKLRYVVSDIPELKKSSRGVKSYNPQDGEITKKVELLSETKSKSSVVPASKRGKKTNSKQKSNSKTKAAD